MYRLSRLKYIFPLGLFIALFLDGSLSKALANLYFHYPLTTISHLAILWIVMAYFYEGDVEIPLLGFAIAIGVVADLYYAGILGLFVFLYPLVVGLTKLLAGLTSGSPWEILLIFLADVFVFDLLNYWAYAAIGIAQVGLLDCLLYSILPTLGLGLIYFVGLFWPLQKLLTWAASSDSH